MNRVRLERLAGMVISVQRKHSGFNVRVVESWDLSTHKEARHEAGGSKRLFPYAIRFSPEFFDDLMRWYVPIPERVLIAFKSSPTEYALMKRILHRSLIAQSASVIPWDSLRAELGSTDSNPRRFRADVRKVLQKLRLAWADLPLAFRLDHSGVRVSPKTLRIIPEAPALPFE